MADCLEKLTRDKTTALARKMAEHATHAFNEAREADLCLLCAVKAVMLSFCVNLKASGAPIFERRPEAKAETLNMILEAFDAVFPGCIERETEELEEVLKELGFEVIDLSGYDPKRTH